MCHRMVQHSYRYVEHSNDDLNEGQLEHMPCTSFPSRETSMGIRQLPKPAFSLVVAGASGGIVCKMPSGISLAYYCRGFFCQ